MERAVARLHLAPQSAAPGISEEAVFQFCYDNKIIGVGWKAGPPTIKPFTWTDYVAASRRPLTSAKTLHDLGIGDVVWVRSPSHQYFMAEVIGEWEYRWEPENVAMDIVNIRPARFVPVPIQRVPDGLAELFRRPPTCQRIRTNRDLIASTWALWKALEAG